MELIKCTPHDVVIFTPYGGKKTIKASGDVARLRETLWPCFTAAASSRGDLMFPIEEVRDEAGRIIGCRGLGFFQ